MTHFETWKLIIGHMTSSIAIFYKEYKWYKLELHAVCGSWDTRECVKDRFGSTSRADPGQLKRPEYWLHKIFSEAATLSQNANCRSNLPEMLAECSTAFSDIQEYYVFLALCISKTNHRTTELKVSIKIENTKGLNPIQDAYATMTKLSTVVSYLKKIPKK